MAPKNRKARKKVRTSQNMINRSQKKIVNNVKKEIAIEDVFSLGTTNVRPLTNFGKKTQRSTYNEHSITLALEAMENGMSLREASAEFKVPKSTLHTRKTGKVVKLKNGPNPALTSDEEDALVNWIFECSRRGFPLRSIDLSRSVQEYLTQYPRPNSFVDNKPGRRWLQCFMRRHPELVTVPGEAESEMGIVNWFDTVEFVLRDEEVFDVLQNSSRVFCAVETGFILGKSLYDPDEDRVFNEPEEKQSQVHFTMVFTFSAAGQSAPPMIVYPKEDCLPPELLAVPNGWGIAQTDTGFLTSTIFYDYIANVFTNYLDEQDVERPVILFVTGHKHQITYQLFELCSENQIVLICLYPNAAKILLPGYGLAFKPLKDIWKQSILESQSNYLHVSIGKEIFSELLQNAFYRCVSEFQIAKGFRQAGLFPWDVNSVDLSKVLTTVSQVPSVNQREEPRSSSTLCSQPTVIYIKTEPS